MRWTTARLRAARRMSPRSERVLPARTVGCTTPAIACAQVPLLRLLLASQSLSRFLPRDDHASWLPCDWLVPAYTGLCTKQALGLPVSNPFVPQQALGGCLGCDGLVQTSHWSKGMAGVGQGAALPTGA